MDELIAKFLPRFEALATERLRKGLEIASQRQHARAGEIVHDLHALAGEAGLLGLETVTALARGAEESAKRYRDQRAEADAAGLVERLEKLAAAVKDATSLGGRT
jgi:HPt (histidine-containing phosphotransfer) domain-containing protein